MAVREIAHGAVERVRMQQHDLAGLHRDGCSAVHFTVIVDHNVA